MPNPAASTKVCLHCGTEFAPTPRRDRFCCTGCEFVSGLIAREGLGQFYDLQEGRKPPVQAVVFEQRDWSWLEQLIVEAEKEPLPMIRLDLQGITCLGCVWLIERLFQRHAGAANIRVDASVGTMTLGWERGVFDLGAFARELQQFGYLVGPPAKTSAGTSRRLIPRLGLCGALAMNTMLFTLPAYLGMKPNEAFATFFDRIAVVLATVSILVGGSYFATRALQSLRRGVIHMDLPITLGLFAAYAGSLWAWAADVRGMLYFDFVAVFTFLMLLGRWLQQRTVERHRHQLLAARQSAPSVWLNGNRADASHLSPGQAYEVEPGGLIPVRSRLRTGSASIGMEWIHGESDATTSLAGDIVPSGALNHNRGRVLLEACEAWETSLLSCLIRIEPTNAPRHRAAEIFVRRYLTVVLCIAALGALAWWWITGDPARALQVLVSVLVVSCPCASGVALPLIDDLAAARLREHGVFLRDHAVWPRLHEVKKIIFDKTGTLTTETLTLQNPDAIDVLTPEQLDALCTLTTASTHPVSTALRSQVLAIGARADATAAVTEQPGMGLEWGSWRLGRAAWASGGAGEGTVFSHAGQVLAAFRFGEEPRADALPQIAAMQARGMQIHILSGDLPAKVSAFSRRIGLDARWARGGMTPQDKADAISTLDARDTLYLGDGANDSLAIERAWCSGTPACDRGLLEHKTDFYFLGHGIAGISRLLEMARIRSRAVRAVVTFAISYNLIVVITALAGQMSPLLAAIVMPLSSLFSLGIVAMMLREKSKENPPVRGRQPTGTTAVGHISSGIAPLNAPILQPPAQ